MIPTDELRELLADCEARRENETDTCHWARVSEAHRKLNKASKSLAAEVLRLRELEEASDPNAIELPGGSLATVKGSFELVMVVRQEGNSVLVKRGSGQTTFNRDQLEPYNPDFCPLD